MSNYPVFIGDSPPEGFEGTIYAHRSAILEAIEGHRRSGVAFFFNQTVSSYCPNKRITYRCIDSFMGASLEAIQTLASESQAAGCPPPSSFGSVWNYLFKKEMLDPRPKIAASCVLRGLKYGGWQQAFIRGQWIKGGVYSYDINSAYRSVSEVGLPDTSKVNFSRRIVRGKPAVYLVRLSVDDLVRVKHLRPDDDGFVWVLSDTIKAFDLHPLEIKDGVVFEKGLISFKKYWEMIDKGFPLSSKKIGRAFWGLWGAENNLLEQVSWGGARAGGEGHEKRRKLKNIYRNPFWALWITQSVKNKVAKVPNVFHVFVDSVIVSQPLETGEAIGDWRLAFYSRDGIWIHATGCWGTARRVEKNAPSLDPRFLMRRYLTMRGRQEAIDFMGMNDYNCGINNIRDRYGQRKISGGNRKTG